MKTGLLLLLMVFSLHGYSQPADSLKKHIDTALLILEANSLYSGKVNWPALREKVYKAAAHATTKAETFTALTLAFTELGDQHAAYYIGDSSFRLTDSALLKRQDDSLKAEWARGARIKTFMMEDIAYISIPTLTGSKQEVINQYANWIYDGVAKLAAQKPKGWIIDLRLNVGGNIRPMMAGLGAFFKDGIVGYYMDRSGVAFEPSSFRNGEFLVDDKVQATINNKISGLIKAKVAVLIGAGTASSGEISAVFLSTRKHTRIFGDATAGLANTTNGFVFDNDNAYFLITVASLANKKKQRLSNYVLPQKVVAANNMFSNLSEDNVVQAAKEWLRKK